MCIGIPMRVVATDDMIAECEGRNGRQRLDNMLVGPVPPGTWLLAFQGRALRVMSEDEAAQTLAALEALDAAIHGGETSFDAYFADLVGREPQLPEHLK
ncbi:MAG: HypC/HybG/HupF family hydrogenase formation chaperone [Burkholderiales bacterium]|jgi:hydrogenase expression/formation protein HypC|nr:HypC/HybG/HupF family hydrogenase formation chaperone [Burkholderiales bacterium]